MKQTFNFYLSVYFKIGRGEIKGAWQEWSSTHNSSTTISSSHLKCLQCNDCTKDKLFQTKCVDLDTISLVLPLNNFLSIRLTISIGDLRSSNRGSEPNYTKYTIENNNDIMQNNDDIIKNDDNSIENNDDIIENNE